MSRRRAGTLALDGAPPIGLGLRRFVLRSVGPPAARFHPLDLDLVTADGTVARRALCVLTNTGGKSTLLKLLSAVVHPGVAGLIGKGEVADMVLATDTAHVVLEWQEADGARYITAWLAQWEGLVRPQTGTKGLRQCWYTFRVGRTGPGSGSVSGAGPGSAPASIGVGDLPFEYDGRRVRWDEYRRQLRHLFGEHPSCAGYIADTQVEWRRALAQRTRIDSELFMYQAKMNADEGGAGALVTRMRTPEAVVGFFVEAFNDDVSTTDTFRQVGTYIAQASGRRTMEVHAGLCAELTEPLGRFLVTNQEYATAQDLETFEVERRRELAGAVRSRAAADAARAAEARAKLEEISAGLAATNRAIEGDDDRRRQYLLLEAEMRREAALAATAQAGARELEADRQRSAWQKVPDVKAHQAAAAAHRREEAAFRAAEEELAPLYAQVEVAAGRLVAGLMAQESEAMAAAADASIRIDAARAAQTLGAERRDSAIRAAAELLSALRAGDERARAAESQLLEARVQGDVGPGETAAEAAIRWAAAGREANARRNGAASDREAARRAQQAAESTRSAAELAVRDAQAEVKAADTELAEAARSCARLADDPDVTAITGKPPAGVPPHRAISASVASSVAATLGAQAAAAEIAASDTYADLRLVEAELDRLAGTDLLDAGEEVARSLAVLRQAQIGAVSGWAWVESAVAAEDRLAFISARPDIANGVVVSDHSRLDDARQALERAGLLPRMAVAVATARAATATADALPLEADRDRFVVEPHPGLYDRAKAEEELGRLSARRDHLAASHAEKAVRGRQLRGAAALALGHSQEWPESRLASSEAHRSQAAARAHEAKARSAEAAAAAVRAGDAEQAAVAAEKLAAREEDLATAAGGRLFRLVDLELAASVHKAARAGILRQIDGHDHAALAASAEIDAAEAAAQVARDLRRDTQDVARTARERAGGIGAKASGTVPSEPVHVLEAEHRALGRHLADEAAGRDHFAALERAQEALATAAQRLGGVGPEVLALAEQLGDSVLAGSLEAIATQARAADEAWKSAVARNSRCRSDAERWAREAQDRSPKDRSAHAVLGPGEAPADPDDASRRATALGETLAEHRALRDRQQAARDLADAALTVAAAAASAFARLVSDQDAPIAGADAYDHDVDSAKVELDGLRREVELAKKLVGATVLARQEVMLEVARRATDKRWGEIVDSLKEQCANVSTEILAEHGQRFLDGLIAREASLRADIAELDIHRAAVISSLGQTCDQLQRSLRRIRSASTIPAAVFGVGGQQAIVVDFKRLAPEVANAALSDVVNDWAATGADVADAKSRQVRLMQALSATVERRPEAGRWSVRLLKPRIDGDVTYCAPDRVKAEYSGGQELTLAVLLYCTLAAVRADDRGGTDRPPGLLLLDNPFGAASNERLIQMQQELAAAADVQLLCLTALSEPSILNGFNGPGTFRQTLRNDRDQRNGHYHVRAVGGDARVQRLVAAHLAGPTLEGGEQSRVSGLGYQTRAAFPPEAPWPSGYPTPDLVPDPAPDAKPDPAPDAKPDPAPDLVTASAPNAKPDPTADLVPDPAAEAEPELTADLFSDPAPATESNDPPHESALDRLL
ncbi:MAG: hypothetical protein ACT4OS_07640 [Acidimicrobiales bacterium]